MIEKFLITEGNYNAILANPTRLKAHNITKIYLRDKKLPSEILREFQQIKNVEIFVNYADSPTILTHTHIHLKSDELHLAKALKSQNLNAESKKSCHLVASIRASHSAQNDKNILPLPCEGGLRGWVDLQKNSNAKFSNSNFTHPLAPSAREGGYKILSYSAHSLKDIIRAHEARIDFIFISPIFAVENKNAPLGIEFLAKIPREIKPKIFALGGINASNIHQFENLGIRGVAGIRIFENIFK
ncbi:thiamine phosphate synthase [Helicobacter sp. 23-1044]